MHDWVLNGPLHLLSITDIKVHVNNKRIGKENIFHGLRFSLRLQKDVT